MILTPPYIPLTKLQRLFDLFETRSLSSLTTEDLISRGFAKSEAGQAIQALKFLGILTSDNKTTDKAVIFSLKGDQSKIKLQELVQVAYKNLFEINKEPYKLSKDELFNEFVAIYKATPRVAKTATPAFLWLCSRAGFPVADEVLQSMEKASKAAIGHPKKDNSKADISKIPTINHSAKTTTLSGYVNDIEISGTGIRLVIPKTQETDDALMAGELGEVRQKLIKFAEKFGLKKHIIDDVQEDR